MKNIKLRKIVVFTLALMVGISLLSACSKQDSSDVQEKSSAAVEKQASSDIEGQDSTDVQVQGSYDIKDDGNYVASGTIPASAKIYPVVDESFPMIITNNEDNLLDFEDIWIINHYVDLMASFKTPKEKEYRKMRFQNF